MNNFVSKSDTVTFFPQAQVRSGELLKIGKLPGVAMADSAAPAGVAVATTGVFRLKKEAGEVFELGQRIYLNEANMLLSNHKTGFFVGHCWEHADSQDAEAIVRLTTSGSEELDNLIWVDDVLNLPEPSEAGVITFEADKSYIITTNLDLLGNRIVCAGNVGILGLNSETCRLKSTGLDENTPLISSAFDLPMKDIDIQHGFGVEVIGTGNNAAIDWNAVNFSNCSKACYIKDVTNFIYINSALLGSAQMQFDGTIGTIGADGCLFQGDGQATDIIQVLPTCVIQRRFRFIFSSFVAFDSQTSAINFSESASVPNDSYILFKCNFSGGANYLSGVQSLDNKADFEGNKGIANSGSVFSYYMVDNAVATPIANTSDWVKIAGITLPGQIVQRFDVATTNNRAIYQGARTDIYKVVGNLAATSGNNNSIGVRIAKNGVVIESSQSKATTNGAGRAESVGFLGVTQLVAESGDFIEVFVSNFTTPNDIVVTDLNIIGDIVR